MSAPDRLQELRKQSTVTGIDFVHVHTDQKTLDVYFLRPPETLDVPLINPITLAPDITADKVRIYSPSGGEWLPEVAVTGVNGTVVGGHCVLRLTTATPGDFTLYRLRLDDPRIDPYFAYATPTRERQVRGHNDVLFSFKANCESDLDCALPEHECPPEERVDFAVEYRARDFDSFRRALLDFASQRYPDWKERLEADAGVMLIEVMSALGDEMAYYQDRVAREAYLETATQRRSLRRHARLVDYVVHDGLAAWTWLDVTASQDGTIKAGADVWALSDTGERVMYEVGRGLVEILAHKTYPVLVARNSLKAHIWDEDDTCLPIGATEVYVVGHHQANLPLKNSATGQPLERWVLLKTNPPAPPRRWVVQLTQVEDKYDPLLKGATGQPLKITRLSWTKKQALPFEMDLVALEVRGNLVPVTAGETKKTFFTIGPPKDATKRAEAVEREGPNGTVAYLFSLPGSKSKDIAWVGSDPRLARPEIQLLEMEPQAGGYTAGQVWQWRRSLLGTNSSQRYDRHFALDDGTWERVVGYRRGGEEIVHTDYAAGSGATIRFGDGEFGLIPPRGTVFRVIYRLGDGRRGNLPVDSITGFEAGLNFVRAVTNPLPVSSGLDPETAQEVRLLAPEAFRAVTYRAVRPEDYAEAAERLPWVQRAGASFRWTGSWLSAFVTPDPRGAAVVTVAFVLITVAPRYIPAAEVSLILPLETVGGIALAWWFLGEVPGENTLWGAAIILSALMAHSYFILKKTQ